MLIKSLAPFGTKILFTEELNPKSIQAELEMDRTTFWRAKRELLKHQLIEFNDHYLRDCFSVDRNQFNVDRNQFKKQHADEPVETKFSDLPISEHLRASMDVTQLQPPFQSCNDRAPEPAQSIGFKTPKPIKKEFKKTTRQEEKPPTHPDVCFSQIREEEEEESPPSTTVSVPLPKPCVKPKTSGSDKLSPGEFLQFETQLKGWGIHLNQNLLKAFYRAGIERVRAAINYLAHKLKDPASAIKNVVGYLVELVRNGDNLSIPKPEKETLFDGQTMKEVLDWIEEGRKVGVFIACKFQEETGEVDIFERGGYLISLQEAKQKYPSFDSFTKL